MRPGLLKSSDGGVTWSFTPSADGNPLYGLSCPTTSTCYAVDDYAHVMTTTNAGASWTPGEELERGMNGKVGARGGDCQGRC